jgi:hypothetical protein
MHKGARMKFSLDSTTELEAIKHCIRQRCETLTCGTCILLLLLLVSAVGAALPTSSLINSVVTLRISANASCVVLMPARMTYLFV